MRENSANRKKLIDMNCLVFFYLVGFVATVALVIVLSENFLRW